MLFSFVIGFLIFVALIVCVAVFAVRRRHFLLPDNGENYSPTAPRAFRPLFEPSRAELAKRERAERHREAAEETERLLVWASLVDFSVLSETRVSGEDRKNQTKNWAAALEILTERVVGREDVGALAAFVLTNRFEPSRNLIESYQQIWQREPTFKTTADLFQLAAQADAADSLFSALVEARHLIETGRLTLRSSELYELGESCLWLLSSAARTSGAGFLLKQKLADLRRESINQ